MSNVGEKEALNQVGKQRVLGDVNNTDLVINRNAKGGSILMLGTTNAFGVRAGEGCNEQQNKDEGKYDSTVECGRGPCNKDNEEGLDTKCILQLGLYW